MGVNVTDVEINMRHLITYKMAVAVSLSLFDDISMSDFSKNYACWTVFPDFFHIQVRHTHNVSLNSSCVVMIKKPAIFSACFCVRSLRRRDRTLCQERVTNRGLIHHVTR